mmetsp:Transcript_20986/g.32686  ORF Transcript_20986/g.32686 Transcript_20986/m.32686 type:complete len:83 (+) Transcript_20986:143-391(+)
MITLGYSPSSVLQFNMPEFSEKRSKNIPSPTPPTRFPLSLFASPLSQKRGRNKRKERKEKKILIFIEQHHPSLISLLLPSPL